MTEEKAEEAVDSLALLKSRRRRHEAVQSNFHTPTVLEDFAWSPEVETKVRDLLREEAARELAAAQAALDAL